MIAFALLCATAVLGDASVCSSFSDPVARLACERLSNSLDVSPSLAVNKRLALSPGLSPFSVESPGSEVPNSCADVLAANGAATDGEYFLTFNNIRTYCADMSSGTPKEYLSLTGDNYGEAVAYKAGVLTRIRTTYTKVLFNPRALVIAIGGADNGRFATTSVDPPSAGLPLTLPNSGEAAFNVSFASAVDCVDDDVAAVAKVDLRGSGLTYLGDWSTVGQMATSTVEVDGCPDLQCATITVKGNCGAANPFPALEDGDVTLNPVNGRGEYQLALGLRTTPAPTAAPTPAPPATLPATTTAASTTSTTAAATTTSTAAATTTTAAASSTSTVAATTTSATAAPSTTTAPVTTTEAPSPTIMPGTCADLDAIGACCAVPDSGVDAQCFVIGCRFCLTTMGSGVSLIFAGQGSDCGDVSDVSTCALMQ